MYNSPNSRLIFVAVVLLIMNMTAFVQAIIIDIPDDFTAIQDGINSSSDGDTVLVQPGIYYENLHFGGHNTMLASLYLTTGDTSYISQTIIDGDSAGTVILFDYDEDRSATVTGFTIQNGAAGMGAGIFCSSANPTISHNIITDNIAFATDGGYGGGICCIYSDALIANNLITRNYASGPLGGFGGGVYCVHQGPTISGNRIINNLGDWGGGGLYLLNTQSRVLRNVIAENTGTFSGGGVYLDEDFSTITNNTITLNESRWGIGGGLYSENNGNPIFKNSICYDNQAFEVADNMYFDSGEPQVTYCNIGGGWAGEGNIDEYPWFRDPDNGDYRLMATDCGDPENSPCIDSGDPDIMDLVVDCDNGLGTIRSDIGAYGGSDSVLIAIVGSENGLPIDYGLYQNYPNPFNASTTISYDLPTAAEATIDIYNILGRRVAEFTPGQQQPGRHEITWHTDEAPSGVYFYSISTDGYTASKKMILLK